ncbi:MAG: hypothetical protein ACK5LK_01355, partial [Chthoniobacterales bacterium]
LITMMEKLIEEKDGVVNQAELKRKEEVQKKRVAVFKKRTGRTKIPHLNHAPKRLSQRSVKFIRWFKKLSGSGTRLERRHRPTSIYQHL